MSYGVELFPLHTKVFPEHTESETRYTRSLYYGVLPATDRPSLPLTRQDLCINVLSPWMHWWSHPRAVECLSKTKLFRLAVDQFTSSGLDALGQKLGRLDMARAADISRQACAGETFHSLQGADVLFMSRTQLSRARIALPGAIETTQP